MNNEDLLLQLFAHWDEARASGRSVSAEELCSAHPELIEPLKLKIAAAEATRVDVVTENLQMQTTPVAANGGGLAATRLLGEPPRRPVGAATTDVELYETTYGQAASGDDLDPQENSLRLASNLTHLQFVAKGGLGIVYRAVDAELNRNVAVKFIQKRFADDSEHNARMVREAEITGQLDHPGIVAVHGMGRSAAGRLFYVMRYIRGTSFRDRIDKFYKEERKADEREFEFRAMLKNFVAACETIAYAHNCGILHRDIKPDNIMIGRFGETLVVDWGLAIPIDRSLKPAGSVEQTLIPNSSSGTSDSGGGTLPYMSPEQAFGGMLLRPASDVYGLGATLYHLLTGRAAFEGNRYEVLEKVRFGRFAPPRQVRSSVPAGLNAICLKAMSQDPSERYALASDLAHDVERWLADLPVAAHRETVFSRAMRWGRRHRKAMRLGIAALMLFAGVVAIVAMFAVRAEQAAETAHDRTLVVTADFYKKTLQKDIHLRWSVLKEAAKDPELISLLEQQNAEIKNKNYATDTPLLEKLHQVNERLFHADQEFVSANVWSLLSADGRQVALSSFEKNRSRRMQSFAYRDYFHGKGNDLDEEVVAPPLRRPHVSCAFVSSTKNWVVTAFSVPVRAKDAPADADPIGVLAMVVDCHMLTNSILGDDQGSRTAMMVELRDYALASKTGTIRSEGLIIQHPNLTTELTAVDGGRGGLKHIDATTLERMRKEPAGLIDFVDPITGGPPRTAAYAQVSIGDPGASDQLNRRWAVIIRE